MKLDEVLDQLSYGELSQVYIGGAQQQGITVDNREQVVSHINLGLIELHKRFLLREGRLEVPLTAGRRTYKLDPNERRVEGFDPWVGDLLKVERVYDDQGHELPLNQEGDPLSVHTPTMSSMYVPDFAALDLPHGWQEPKKLTVVYRQSHPRIDKTYGAFTPEEVEVELPYAYLEPLLLYVASRVHTPVGPSMDGQFHDGNNYAAKFERACELLTNQNYRVELRPEEHRFRRRGFV